MRSAVHARLLCAAMALLFLLLSPLSSLAATYTDVAGTTVQFTNINDELGLWLQPSASGDTLIFNPTAYTASCPGAGCPAGAVEVDDTLEFTIDANPGESLGILLIEEWGTSTITLDGGIVQTGVDALLTNVGVTELDGTPVNTLAQSGGNLVFAPGDTFNADGVVNFYGSVLVDLDALIAAQSPGETRSATSVTIILNNPLTSFSFGGGGLVDGTITKDEFRVTVVPEPGTALLMGLGLVGLASMQRRNSFTSFISGGLR